MGEGSNPFDLSQYSGHRPVTELVYLALRRAILQRTVLPGQRLATEELAALMKVSRTPVREALRKLELEGLVEGEPWRGTVVAGTPPLTQMEEFYYLRGALEGVVAYFAARKRPRQELVLLQEVMQEMKKAVEDGNLNRFMELQVTFWDQYIGLANSKRLFQMASSIRDYLEWAKPVSLSQPGRMGKAFLELKAVVEAIEAGNPTMAEMLAREHCRCAYEAFRTAMEQRAVTKSEELSV